MERKACKTFVRRYIRNDRDTILSPKSKKMINIDGVAARRIFFECGGDENQLVIQEVEYPEDYRKKYMEVYESTLAHKITNPKTGKLILAGGAEAANIYQECKAGKLNPPKAKKAKRTSVPASDLKLYDPVTCERFVRFYDQLQTKGRVAKLRSPITNRPQRTDGAAAKKSYIACKNGVSPAKKKASKKKVVQKKPRSKAPKRKGTCLERSKIMLREHQKNMVKFINRQDQRGAIAAFETGSGKTLTAIASAVCALDANPEAHILVVSKPSLVSNFKKEMVKFGLSRDDDRFEFISETKLSNKIHAQDSQLENICTPDTFLIVDEAHNLKGEIKFSPKHNKYKGGKKAKALVECSKNVWKVLLLTATPIPNNPYDVANLIAMVNGEDPPKPAEFKRMVEDDDTTDFDDFFSCKIYFYNDVDRSEFPEQIISDVQVEMNDEYYNEYMKVENKTLMGQGLGRFDSDPFAFLSGLRQAANILPNNPKVDWAVNKIVETARIGRTSLIFSNFKEAGVFLVADRLGEEYPNIKYEMITGDISTKKRDNIVEKYNNGEISALFITEAGSEGLDLKKTKSVILLERSWNIAAEKQVMGRAVRYKSHDGEEDKLVNVYRLMVVKPPGNTDKYPSADKMLETIIEQKVETIQNFISRIVSIEDCLD